jgi:NADH-quinone oxidoreductase subunit G
MSTETQTQTIPMVTLSIDGREVQVPKGTNVIEAARKLGIDIPYLCYHHQLTSFGGCRLCLVEVEKVPKLLAACNTTVADGMVVRTTGRKVKEQREGTLEFILLNHPLDCPVCDKGGECELQDRVYEHSNALSRLTEPKVHIEDYDLGPLIVRNQDRCIICKRCIKVMEEIVGEPVLEFGQRGVTTEVFTFEHEEFQAGFSGNTIRVCPVGALMSKPFRFTARPWELIKTPSVCSLCSVGCNLREDVRENKLLRVVGLENPQVNDAWLCDRGMFGYDYINSPQRLTAPLVRRSDGELEKASWEEAIALVASRLRAVREAGGGFGAIGSERASNEDNITLQRFTREVMGSPNIDHRMGGPARDYLAHRPAPGAIVSLAAADVVLLVGTDLTAEAPVMDLILKRGLLGGTMKLIVAHPRRTALNKFAHQWIQYTPGEEIAVVNGLLRALSVGDAGGNGGSPDSALSDLAARAGVDAEALTKAASLFAGARLGSIVYGQGAASGRGGDDLVQALNSLAAAAGHTDKDGYVFLEAVQQANTWGARDMGLLPGTGPGGASAEEGLATGEMLRAAAAGELQALWVMGSNPLVDFPGSIAAEAVQRLEFLVVQDLFLTETAMVADVVLPSTSVAERNCTFTNIEGRVQRAVRAMAPRGSSKPDWLALARVAEAMGQDLGFDTEDAVIREIRRVHSSIRKPDATPPRPGEVDVPLGAEPDASHPLRLFTGRLMFDRGGLQRYSAVLPGLAPEPFVEIHPSDAGQLGVAAGDSVTVATAGGQLALTARVTEDVPAGSAFVPSGYDAAPVARLWVEGARTVPCRVQRLEAAA